MQALFRLYFDSFSFPFLRDDFSRRKLLSIPNSVTFGTGDYATIDWIMMQFFLLGVEW